MNTLVVYYSKTGNTEKVAKAIIEKKNCDFDILEYDDKTKKMSSKLDPALYEHIILLSPIWAFSLAEPMKQYILKHNAAIKQYDLVVTCGGIGLRGCIKNCLSSIGFPPRNAMKFRSKQVKSGDFDISAVI
ncbi:MAG: hypothetical protein FWG88_03105 [Oscillospiraceae bacterium]|nr:hypothetical protein [Oscillospiraceae bacterium]